MTAEVKVTMTKDRVGVMLKAVESLTKKETLVGVPSDKSDRDPSIDEVSDPPTNAQIGYWMEYGVPDRNIPARPFLIPGVASRRDQIADVLEGGAKAALDGNKARVDQTFDRVGLIAQSAVQEKITDGPFVPLSEITLKRRKARTPPRMGEKPLIDSGQLRQSISYIIRDKGKS